MGQPSEDERPAHSLGHPPGDVTVEGCHLLGVPGHEEAGDVPTEDVPCIEGPRREREVGADGPDVSRLAEAARGKRARRGCPPEGCQPEESLPWAAQRARSPLERPLLPGAANRMRPALTGRVTCGGDTDRPRSGGGTADPGHGGVAEPDSAFDSRDRAHPPWASTREPELPAAAAARRPRAIPLFLHTRERPILRQIPGQGDLKNGLLGPRGERDSSCQDEKACRKCRNPNPQPAHGPLFKRIRRPKGSFGSSASLNTVDEPHWAWLPMEKV
jgi:hypothetical protein